MSAPGQALECMGGCLGVPEKRGKSGEVAKYGLNGQYHFATLPLRQVPKTLVFASEKARVSVPELDDALVSCSLRERPGC